MLTQGGVQMLHGSSFHGAVFPVRQHEQHPWSPRRISPETHHTGINTDTCTLLKVFKGVDFQNHNHVFINILGKILPYCGQV